MSELSTEFVVTADQIIDQYLNVVKNDSRNREIRALREVKVLDYLKRLAKVRSSNALFSKKQRIHLEQQVFCVKLEAKNGAMTDYLYFRVQCHKRGLQYLSVELTEIKTPKGRVFVAVTPEEGLKVYAFTAHVFDRLVQRQFKDDAERADAIYWVAVRLLKEDRSRSITESEYKLVCQEGMFLGDALCLDESGYRPLTRVLLWNQVAFIFLKTFISSDMYREQQKRDAKLAFAAGGIIKL